MPSGRCRLGFARIDITPPAGIYHRSWGAAKHDASTGVHRELTASALVFTGPGSGEEHALVVLELGWLQAADLQRLSNTVSHGTGLPAERLVITFSHTHAAGNYDPDRLEHEGGALIPGYLDDLGKGLSGLVEEARAAVKPVELAFGYGRCDLAYNRDYWDDGNQLYAVGSNPDRDADDTVVVTRASDREGRLVATLVNYSCHPTTLAWDNTLISPDYPGAMREVVERETGAPCVFVLGASGDLGPRYGFVGETEAADRNGLQLGYAALSALEGLLPDGTEMRYDGPVISGATIGVWRTAPVDAERAQGLEAFNAAAMTLDLPLLDLPGQAELDEQLAEWTSREKAAAQAGLKKETADCRARIERVRRAMRRIESIPPNRQSAPYGVTLWRIGEGVLVLVSGEPYNVLQRALRARFPATAIVVVVLCNRGTGGYLLPADDYGKGLYQEEAASIGPGGLEAVIAAIERQLAAWGLQ